MDIFYFIVIFLILSFLEKFFVRLEVKHNIDLFYALYRKDVICVLKKEGKLNDL